MNFPLIEPSFDQQRCRQWTPLITQQLRLRHLYRVTAYNVVSSGQGSYYFTLHLTTMCAPFYTSEKIDSSCPKWSEINVSNSPAAACVLRIWQTSENEMDNVVLTWGINFSGLIHVGNNIANVQPSSFKNNSVILHLRGGLFTSIATLRTDLQTYVPFIDGLNVVSTEDSTKIYRTESTRVPIGSVRKSYDVDKLRKLQSLQLVIRNRSLDVQELADNIRQKCPLCCDTNCSESPSSPIPSASSNTDVRYAPQLLTMSTLNKMLHEKPTKVQQREIIRIRKEIEVAKFKTKLLSQERDKKSVRIRRLNQKLTKLMDENQEKASQLMEKYMHLSKEIEKLRDYKNMKTHQKELLQQFKAQLEHRRRQLLSQLLYLYPIESNPEENVTKICGIVGPTIIAPGKDAYSSSDFSVVLGYIAHILVMCSSFLQVPLCYPIMYMGSRSVIIDLVTPSLGDTTEYPLFNRGKSPFCYGFWLLNKNILQLCWSCNRLSQGYAVHAIHDLLLLLKGTDDRSGMNDVLTYSGYKKMSPHTAAKQIALAEHLSQHHSCEDILDALRHENNPSPKPTNIPTTNPTQVLSTKNLPSTSADSNPTSAAPICDIDSTVEQGTDLLDLNVNNIDVLTSLHRLVETNGGAKQQKRISRSVGSYTDDEAEHRNWVSLGSDPVLNTSVEVGNGALENLNDDANLSNVKQWLDDGSADRRGERSEYVENFSPLTLRTTALLNTTSFNLVKPKF